MRDAARDRERVSRPFIDGDASTQEMPIVEESEPALYLQTGDLEEMRSAYSETLYHLRQLARSCKPVYDLLEPRFDETREALARMRVILWPDEAIREGNDG